MTTTRAEVFLTARWNRLAMLNYEVDPAILRNLVPSGTELDTWEGRCVVSVVGFQFRDTRVRGLSIPFHRDFEEVNLRFYVKRTVDGEVRRGVVFVKEIVPLRAVAFVANALYGEKYVALPTFCEDRIESESRSLAYGWDHGGRSCRLVVTADGDLYLPDERSEEAFITEHYWGYARQRDGSTLEYQVEHPRWQVWRARDQELTCDAAALYGQGFAAPLSARPTSSFIADGSEILVRRGVLLDRHVVP